MVSSLANRLKRPTRSAKPSLAEHRGEELLADGQSTVGQSVSSVEALVSSLKAHSDVESATSGCEAIRDAVAGAPSLELGEQVVRVANVGALEALVEALSAYPESPGVQEAGIEAIRNITRVVMGQTTEFIRPRAISAGAVEAVVGGMRAFLPLSAIQLVGSSFLINATVADDALMQEVVKRALAAGAVEVMTKAIQAHGGEPTVAEKLAGVVGNLASTEVIADKEEVVAQGGLASLLELLARQADSDDVCRACLCAIDNVASATSATLIGSLVEQGAPHLVVQAMTRHTGHEELCDYGVLILDSLASAGPTGLSAVASAGGGPAAEAAMATHKANADLVETARAIVAKLGTSTTEVDVRI